MSRIIRVHVDLGGHTIPAGTAVFQDTRGRIVTSFNYDPAYLQHPHSYQLDPQLPLETAPSTLAGLPGAFHDASPDRWGKNLIRRESDQVSTRRKQLTDVDFLLESSDEPRQGSLRFTTADGEPYVEDHGEVPKVLELENLLDASFHVQRDDQFPVKQLLQAGSDTLGGARPKAAVREDTGTLMIAKFPATTDEWDVIRWEKTALDLARAAGIHTPRNRLELLGGAPVLIIERFDRSQGGRIGYASARTLLGPDETESADYLHIAEELGAISDDYSADIEELYRRMVFSVAIHNTDDHLRNHGILRSSKGWRLSPVFDVNPNPNLSSSRSTGIAGAYLPADEGSGLIDIAQELDIAATHVAGIIAEVVGAVAEWDNTALINGVSESEIRRFAPMFHQQLDLLHHATEPLA